MSRRPDGDEKFFDRWSRLKREPEQETPVVAEPDVEAPPVEDERPDEEILAELGLPHPETLQPGDDIKGFMEAAVPDRLRRLALRQLWRSNPVLANLDELVEYGEDYTDAATVVENLQTAYQVGKGMLRTLAQEEDEDETAEDETAVSSEVDPSAGDPTADDPGAQESEAAARADDAPALDPAEPPAEPEFEQGEPVEATSFEPDITAPTRRRMAFSFDN